VATNPVDPVLVANNEPTTICAAIMNSSYAPPDSKLSTMYLYNGWPSSWGPTHRNWCPMAQCRRRQGALQYVAPQPKAQMCSLGCREGEDGTSWTVDKWCSWSWTVVHPQLVQAWTSRLLEADCRNTRGAVKVVEEVTKFIFSIDPDEGAFLPKSVAQGPQNLSDGHGHHLTSAQPSP
jgi:hypothetical protein